MRNNRMTRNHLPLLQEEERIYLNVTYRLKNFAKTSNCGFDADKELWFTGLLNSNLKTLVSLYGVNEVTSDDMKHLLEKKLGSIKTH